VYVAIIVLSPDGNGQAPGSRDQVDPLNGEYSNRVCRALVLMLKNKGQMSESVFGT
jgi:hypothetical protein